MSVVQETNNGPSKLVRITGSQTSCTVVANEKTEVIQFEKLTIVIQFASIQEKSRVNHEDLVTAWQKDNEKGLTQLLQGGYFALISDNQSGTIKVVNDHVGIQPCYHLEKDGEFFVGSHLKSLKALFPEFFTISKQAIYNYFYFHCIPAPLTIYQQCFKLPPGTILDVNNSCKVSYWFNPRFAKNGEETNASDMMSKCVSIVSEQVKRNVSPECGAFLSGGLDSSTVAGMLSKHASKANTFSLGFNVAAYDETPYAKITSEHFNTDNHVLYLEPEEAVNSFIDVAQYFDEPFGNSSALAVYFCAKYARQHDISTLLAGDGGDELFAGNERYVQQKKLALFDKLPGFLQSVLKVIFVNPVAAKIPLVKKASSYVSQASSPLVDRMEKYNFLNQFGVENIFEENFLQDVDISLPKTQQQERLEACRSDDLVDQMLYLDWKFTLADNDLVKVNRMCELAGVDVVYPLLERDLVEFSTKLTSEQKLPEFKLRQFYKDTFANFLSEKTLNKSKHGFGLPFGIWIKENSALNDITTKALESFRNREIIKQSLLDEVVEAHRNVHSSYYGEFIWIIVTMELWLQGLENKS